MEWVEVTGATIAEAKDRALDRLGVDEADAEFEVLEEPQKGFFGRVKGEARVRARVRPTAPRPKAERNDRRRKGRERSSATTTVATPNVEPAEVPALADDRTEDEAATDATGDRGGAAKRRRRRPNGEREAGMDAQAAVRPGDATSVDQGPLVGSFLTGLVDAFGLEGSVHVDVQAERLVAAIDGQGLGLLIGPRGRTSTALAEITRAYVQRQVPEGVDRPIAVDVASYRERRRAALEAFVDRIVAEVRDSGEGVVLEPMSSADRKIVHDRVAESDGVTSSSVGDDPRRRVVIDPRS